MRMFLTGAFIVLALPPAPAAETDADKAKAAVTAFLAALKAKDIDAVVKTTDVPFVLGFARVEEQTFDTADALKAALKPILKQIDPDTLPTAVGTVSDMDALAKKAKEQGGEKVYAAMEKHVGKSGYMVRVPTQDGKDSYGVLVRMKGGKAYVAATTK